MDVEWKLVYAYYYKQALGVIFFFVTYYDYEVEDP